MAGLHLQSYDCYQTTLPCAHMGKHVRPIVMTALSDLDEIHNALPGSQMSRLIVTIICYFSDHPKFCLRVINLIACFVFKCLSTVRDDVRFQKLLL